MGMTIEQIIKYLPAPICGSTVIGKEKQKEYDAHDSAIIILRKYQKIEEVYKNWCYPTHINAVEAMNKLGEVLKDDKEKSE